jgi:dopamine beta-monooxygenase
MLRSCPLFHFLVLSRAAEFFINGVRPTATVVRMVAVFIFVSFAATLVVVQAHPAYQDAIPNGASARRLGVAWPGVGHMAAAGGGNAENSFGAAFAAAGHAWTSALCNADTDGDGVSNGNELGDPACNWTVGATPERTSDISHPGFADSFPANTPSYRIVGPTPFEGMLQARIYPHPWGAVSWGHVTTLWSREYCIKAGAFDPAWITRAWEMHKIAPNFNGAYWQWDYAPQDPFHYVAISDRGACNGIDMNECTYAYSYPGTPQNSTSIRYAMWVDCRYSQGTKDGAPRMRIAGPDPGIGSVQTLVPPQYTHPTTSGWQYTQFLNGMAKHMCHRIFGITDFANPQWTFRGTSSSNYANGAVVLRACDEATPLDACEVTYSSFSRRNWWQLECSPPPPATSHYGPSTLEAVGHMNATLDQSEFEALIISTFPESSITQGDITLRYFNRNMTTWGTHFALSMNHRAGLNGNSIVAQLASPAYATSIFEITSEKVFAKPGQLLWWMVFDVDVRLQPDPSPPAGAALELRIAGPQPWEGILQGRVDASHEWGAVVWPSNGAAWDRAICAFAGSAAPDDFIVTTSTVAAESASAAPYVPAGDYVSITDVHCDDVDPADVAKCRYVASPPGLPKNSSNVTAATYINCRGTTYPAIRLVGAHPGQGYREVRFSTDTEWRSAEWEQPKAQTCDLLGFANPSPLEPSHVHVIRTVQQHYRMKECNLSQAMGLCPVDVLDPPVTTTTDTPLKCRLQHDLAGFVPDSNEKHYTPPDYEQVFSGPSTSRSGSPCKPRTSVRPTSSTVSPPISASTMHPRFRCCCGSRTRRRRSPTSGLP